MTIRIHYRPSIEIRFSTIPGDTDQGFGHPPKEKSRAQPATKLVRPRLWDIHVVEYARDSNYGLCPAVMATTVRRFPLGMTIDDRGVARATSFLFYFQFFISSAVATGPVGTKT